MDFNNVNAISYLKARNLMCGELKCEQHCPFALGSGICGIEKVGHEKEAVQFVMSWTKETAGSGERAYETAPDSKATVNQKALSEALDAVENGMCRIADTRDIWQNELLYALCQTVRLLGANKLKEQHNTKN